jgi:hypothetical protein
MPSFHQYFEQSQQKLNGNNTIDSRPHPSGVQSLNGEHDNVLARLLF